MHWQWCVHVSSRFQPAKTADMYVLDQGRVIYIYTTLRHSQLDAPLHSFKEHDALPFEKSTRNGITAVIEIWEGSGACISGLPSRVFVPDYRMEKSRDPRGKYRFHGHLGDQIPKRVRLSHSAIGLIISVGLPVTMCREWFPLDFRSDQMTEKWVSFYGAYELKAPSPMKLRPITMFAICCLMEVSIIDSKRRITSHALPTPGNASTTNSCALPSLRQGWYTRQCFVTRLSTNQRSWSLSDPHSTKGSGELRIHPMGECVGVTKSK